MKKDDELVALPPPERASGPDQRGDQMGALIPSTPAMDWSKQIPREAYAVRALEAAAVWEPDAMERLADILERAPHYASCEAQWLRGIAWRLRTVYGTKPGNPVDA